MVCVCVYSETMIGVALVDSANSVLEGPLGISAGSAGVWLSGDILTAWSERTSVPSLERHDWGSQKQIYVVTIDTDSRCLILGTATDPELFGVALDNLPDRPLHPAVALHGEGTTVLSTSPQQHGIPLAHTTCTHQTTGAAHRAKL